MPALGDTSAGLLTIVALIALLALAYVPLGDYLAAVLTPTRHNRVERVTYRVIGVNPDGQQSARSYILAVLGFSAVSIVVLFAILVGQAARPSTSDRSPCAAPSLARNRRTAARAERPRRLNTLASTSAAFASYDPPIIPIAPVNCLAAVDLTARQIDVIRINDGNAPPISI